MSVVVPSLQCLCLKRVINDDIKNYEDLPTVLVRKINKMRLFNGSYTVNVFKKCYHTLIILYDGDCWNFKGCMYDRDKCYCISSM